MPPLARIVWCSRFSPWRLCTPVRILGTNAVLGFILSIIFAKFAGAPWFHIDGATVTAQETAAIPLWKY